MPAARLRLLDRSDQRRGQRARIHFEPNRKCSGRTNTGPDSSELLSFNRFMKLKRTAPEIFIAEGVVTKRTASTIDRLQGMHIGCPVAPNYVVFRRRRTLNIMQQQACAHERSQGRDPQSFSNPVHNSSTYAKECEPRISIRKSGSAVCKKIVSWEFARGYRRNGFE